MSAPKVDVLEEITATIEWLQTDGWTDRATALAEARAVMAEVIEASNKLVLKAGRLMVKPADWARLEAALARIGGAA